MRNAGRLACLVWFAVWITASPAAAQEAAEKSAEALIKGGKHADAIAALAGTRPSGEAAARIDLLRATALRALGRLDESTAAAERARRAATAARAPGLEARALLQLAQVASDRGENDEAAALLAPALPAARASKDPTLPITVLEALGRNARTRGDNQLALEHQGAAITAAESAQSLELIVRARGARSATLLGLGRFDEALADAQAAYDRVSAAPARLKAVATFALAQVQAHLWNLERAAVLWGEAIEHYRAAGLQIGIALSTRQRMETWFALGEFDRAAADGAEALRMFERTGSAGTTADVYARLALIEARRGNAPQARAYAARAAALPQDGPRRRFTENDLGLTALYLGDHAEAATRFTSVLDQAMALGDQEYIWRALHMRGRSRLAAGDQDGAEADLRRAVSTLERMRRTLPEAGQRASFMSDRRDVFATLAEAVMRRANNDPALTLESLAIAEQSRARSLVDQIAESDARRNDPRLDQIRKDEQAFAARLTALQQRVQASPAHARPAALADLAKAEAAYEALLVSLRRNHAGYAAIVNPQPLDHRALRSLPARGEAIISYLFTFDGGRAWVLRDGRVTSFAIPDRRRIESQVKLFSAMVQGRDIDGLHTLGASLHKSLLGPARADLEGAARITIIPDGPLHRLPFALLRPAGGSRPWLAETMPITLAPSATVLAHLRGRQRSAAAGALAAFAAGGGGATRAAPVTAIAARSSLEHADREINEIARIVSDAGNVRVVPKAMESAVKRDSLHGYRIVHFAAHAAVDEISPRRSAILLGTEGSEDGLLQLNEIAALDLNARLVVAATCRSQVGRSVSGEGLMSLSRAFLQAGSDAVVAALWDVDDEETRKFMRHFYAAMRRGMAPDEALGEAQRSMIDAGGRSASPENWAGFVLTGSAASPIFNTPPAPAVRPVWPIAAAAALIAGLLFAGLRRRGATRRAVSVS